MTDNETTRLKAEAQRQEAVFVIGVIGIVDQAGAFIEKNGPRLLERDTVLMEVSSILTSIPGNSIFPTAIY